jgi:hypothetical protein
VFEGGKNHECVMLIWVFSYDIYILQLSYSFSLSGFVCVHLPASVKTISCTWP